MRLVTAYSAELGADWKAALVETLISLMDDQLLSAVAGLKEGELFLELPEVGRAAL